MLAVLKTGSDKDYQRSVSTLCLILGCGYNCWLCCSSSTFCLGGARGYVARTAA